MHNSRWHELVAIGWTIRTSDERAFDQCLRGFPTLKYLLVGIGARVLGRVLLREVPLPDTASLVLNCLPPLRDPVSSDVINWTFAITKILRDLYIRTPHRFSVTHPLTFFGIPRIISRRAFVCSLSS